jgi:hypothetical protein
MCCAIVILGYDRERPREMLGGWIMQKRCNIPTVSPISPLDPVRRGFGIGDNASEGNYGERYRYREREGMREGEGRKGEGGGDRCDFLVPSMMKAVLIKLLH